MRSSRPAKCGQGTKSMCPFLTYEGLHQRHGPGHAAYTHSSASSCYGSPDCNDSLHDLVQREPLHHGTVSQTLHELHKVDAPLRLRFDFEEQAIHFPRAKVRFCNERHVPGHRSTTV